jgi:transposase
MRFQFIEDSMNSAKFIKFLNKLHKDAGQPILVITDNAKYHHSKETQKLMSKKGKYYCNLSLLIRQN